MTLQLLWHQCFCLYMFTSWLSLLSQTHTGLKYDELTGSSMQLWACVDLCVCAAWHYWATGQYQTERETERGREEREREREQERVGCWHLEQTNQERRSLMERASEEKQKRLWLSLWVKLDKKKILQIIVLTCISAGEVVLNSQVCVCVCQVVWGWRSHIPVK